MNYDISVMKIKHKEIPFIRSLLKAKQEEDIVQAEIRFSKLLQIIEKIHCRISSLEKDP